MQRSCIGSLMELAEKDERVLYLTADSGEGGLDMMFKRYFADRSFEFGIAEENMVAVASGLAASGKIPFVYTAGPFLAYRAFEFIRDDICLQNLPVKLIGAGSGLSVSSLGPTHHTTEDIAILRSLPNLTIYSPATPKQAFECIKEAYKQEGPVYIRLGLNGEKEYLSDDYQFVSGEVEILEKGNDIAIFTTGGILEVVMELVELLREKGIGVTLVNVPTLKPLNSNSLNEIIRSVGAVCTIEEHNIIGGLGSIIADEMVKNGIAKKNVRIGLKDCFSKGYGSLKELRIENGLGARQIYDTICRECL